MERILNQTHSKETFYYALSKVLERMSYYGFRSLIVLYMIGESIQMEKKDATAIYSWFIGSIVYSQIIGALFGDLILGNRKSIIIGGIAHAIGIVILCISSTTSLYLGLFLIVLGSGFYTPNVTSTFGKLYLSKTKLLDSGFTIFYLAINLGAFLGVLLIGYLGDTFGFKIAFITSGLLMLLSIVPFIALQKNEEYNNYSGEHLISNKISNIILGILAVTLFWGIYEISNIRIFDLQMYFSEISAMNISNNLWHSINSIITIPFSLIAIVVWTFFYNSQFVKLIFGFAFGAISYGLIYLIPEVPTEDNILLYFVGLLFLGISEIHIAPIIHSILTKYSNPKYLTILISLIFLPSRLFAPLFGLFSNNFNENPTLGLTFGIITMTFVGIGIFIYIRFKKKSSYYNILDNQKP